MRGRNDCTPAQRAQIEKIEARYNRVVDRWTGNRGYDGPDQNVMLVDFERNPGERLVSADIKAWDTGKRPSWYADQYDEFGFAAELTTWERHS